jgi:hypothetical protein
MAVGIENVDEAIAGTGDIVMLFRVLLGISDEEIAVDVLDAERGKTCRNIRISEATAYFCRRRGPETARPIGGERIAMAKAYLSLSPRP